MARNPRLAAPETSQPARVDVVAWPVLFASAVLGAAAAFLVIRDLEPSPAALVLGAAAVLVAVLGVPLAVSRGTALVVALCAALVLSPTSAPSGVILLGLELVCLALVLAVGRGQLARRGAGPRLRVTALVGAGAYLALLLMSTVVAENASRPVIVAISVVGPGVLTVMVARAFTADDLRVFARGLVGFAVLQVVVATTDLLIRPLPFLGYTALDGGSRLTNALLAERLPRAQAMVGHPIILALLIVVAVGLTWLNTVKLPRGVRIALVSVLAAGLVMSGTRSAIVALAVAVIYLSLASTRSVGRRIRNGLVISIGALILAAIPASAQYLAIVAADLSESGSYTHRTGAWGELPAVLSRRDLSELLFGTGSGSEHFLFNAGFLQQDGLNVVDNQFVTTIIGAGFVGLLLLLLLMVRTIARGSTSVRVTMIMLLVMLNAFDLLRWPGPAILVFACFGLVDNPAFRKWSHASQHPRTVANRTSGLSHRRGTASSGARSGLPAAQASLRL